tara:strand:+ start:4533 stop:4901 length:369 start_codon:yes stop_codon:yes gene_type:complete
MSKKFIAIYNANGGILGEIRYFLGKIFKDKHCELCDITHILAWKKKSWKEFEKLLGCDLQVLHLNDQSSTMKKITDNKTPCILVKKENSYEILITYQDLASCGSSVSKFIKLFNSKKENYFV